MTIVLDASCVVAALVDGGQSGAWTRTQMAGGDLVAPHHLPAEVAHALRRAEVGGRLDGGLAALAHRDLLRLAIRLFPFGPLATRVWELRHHVATYDAWYVALAESLRAPLVTLDVRLARAHDIRCDVVTP